MYSGREEESEYRSDENGLPKTIFWTRISSKNQKSNRSLMKKIIITTVEVVQGGQVEHTIQEDRENRAVQTIYKVF